MANWYRHTRSCISAVFLLRTRRHRQHSHAAASKSQPSNREALLVFCINTKCFCQHSFVTREDLLLQVSPCFAGDLWRGSTGPCSVAPHVRLSYPCTKNQNLYLGTGWKCESYFYPASLLKALKIVALKSFWDQALHSVLSQPEGTGDSVKWCA